MSEKLFRKTLSPWVSGLCVTLLGLGVSLLLAHKQSESLEQLEVARFAQATNAVTESLLRRIDTYTEIAMGLRGLFIVNPELGVWAAEIRVVTNNEV